MEQNRRCGNKKAPQKRGLLQKYRFKEGVSLIALPSEQSEQLVQLWACRNKRFTFIVVGVLIKVVDKAFRKVFRFAFPL